MFEVVSHLNSKMFSKKKLSGLPQGTSFVKNLVRNNSTEGLAESLGEAPAAARDVVLSQVTGGVTERII